MQIYVDKKQYSKKKRAIRIRLYLSFFVVLFAIIGIFYLIVFSPFLKVRFILIENNKFLTEDYILDSIEPLVINSSFGSLAGVDNLLSWPSGKITTTDPAFLNVVIKKKWIQRGLEIRIDERERFAIWCFSDKAKCYWIDKEGIIFKEAPSTNGSLVLSVFDLREEGLGLGSIVEEKRFVKNLIVVLENLNKTGFSVKKIIFDKDLKELHVNTFEGPNLFFSVRFDVSENILSIKNIEHKNIEYIDLRVENKFYLQYK
ncbi:hypothetical protein KJ671_03915 [Patescibacteria group bacterium]|nr:hypothetical protein [Patescibacteria group bacterium]